MEVSMKRSHFCIIFMIFLILSGLSCRKQQELGSVLEKEIPKLMEKAGIPGLTMAVVRNGEIYWSGAFGVRSRKTNVPVDENTIFEGASLTKTVTAVAALKMVERGELDLDKPLAEYLPYPRLAEDERYKKITARHVLTHTTGLPNWGNKLIREPGQLYGYSGEGFLYLGRTIEKLSGMSLEDFAKKEVFEPLGMARTSYVWNDLYAENGATGHDRHGFANERRRRTEPNGGASLVTTARDYATFICSIMSNSVLKAETIDQMLTPHVRATKRGEEEQDKLDEHISWGFGWGIQPGEDENGFWHWGDNGDLRAYTVFYGKRKEGLIFLANSENLFTIAEELVSLVLDDPQYSFNWLKYKRHDDPERIAMMTVEKTFLEEGNSAGLSKLEEMKNQYPKAFDTEDLSDVARYLIGRDKKDEAEAIFKWIIDSDAESVVAWTGIGEIYLETGRNKESLECIQRILELDPENSLARTSLPWVKELIEVEENPVSVAEELLGKYAGDYGPRHVGLKEGSLYYQRSGRPEYRLVPLKEDTFALEGYGVFRLRFVMDEKGDVTKVIGIYLGGYTDESERNK
jgi:CubicO group peptidase (beta-lactamase class C family)